MYSDVERFFLALVQVCRCMIAPMFLLALKLVLECQDDVVIALLGFVLIASVVCVQEWR